MEDIAITPAALSALNPTEYTLVDIRGRDAAAYGIIPGAKNIPACELDEAAFAALMDENRDKLIIYCQIGKVSEGAAEILRGRGAKAYHLEGGYLAWLAEIFRLEAKNREEKTRQIELSIRKTFHSRLFSKFAAAINNYRLMSPGDKIAVCISGGKDSMLMAKLFQELKRHDRYPFELVFLVMDPGYSPENRRVIENNALTLDIPVKIFESNIFDAVYEIKKSPCYLCARMRRGHLYSEAQKLGCNKIALGHHYDDVIETILMGMLYGGQVQTMMPKLRSANFPGMELIRPMYLIREESIKAWRDYNDLRFLRCACKFTDSCSSCSAEGISDSKRTEIKNLIAELKKTNPAVEANIFKSVENVNLSTVIAYKKQGIKTSFLDNYDNYGETT